MTREWGEMDDRSKGQPGEPGQDAHGASGGTGGQGGSGGEGQQSGGAGGQGGPGGSSVIGRNRGDAQRALWLVVVATAVLYLVNAAIGTVGYIQNNNRIADIQASRVSSCERTYQAFVEVFRPFFPPITSRTEQQKRDVAKFNRTVAHLKSQCMNQTKP